MDTVNYYILAAAIIIITVLTVLYFLKKCPSCNCPTCPSQCPVGGCPSSACPACPDPQTLHIPGGTYGGVPTTAFDGPKIYTKYGNNATDCQTFCTNNNGKNNWGQPYKNAVYSYDIMGKKFMDVASGTSGNTLCGCIDPVQKPN